MKVIYMLSESTELPKKLLYNAKYFREGMVDAGFDIVPGETAIVPVMLYDEPLAVIIAEMLLKKEDLDKAINAFTGVSRILGVCG
jgi:glycine C-acetyltransferase